MDENEIEKALRFCGSGQGDCDDCRLDKDCENKTWILNKAAECIAATHARIAELEEEVKTYKKHGLEPCDYAGIVVSDNRAKKARDDLSVLMKECTRLQSHDKEAMELLEAAVADAEYLAYLVKRAGEKCNSCYKSDKSCTQSSDCWRWQHADRYEALKAQSTIFALRT